MALRGKSSDWFEPESLRNRRTGLVPKLLEQTTDPREIDPLEELILPGEQAPLKVVQRVDLHVYNLSRDLPVQDQTADSIRGCGQGLASIIGLVHAARFSA
jgi:hypothetical protein